jgi:hypothetical protein
VPAGGRIRPVPRAARASCLPALGPAREVLTGLGQVMADNTRSAASQEAWPELRQRGRKLPGESRGGTPADERARKARAASDGAVVKAQRLPAFRFLLPRRRKEKEKGPAIVRGRIWTGWI